MIRQISFKTDKDTSSIIKSTRDYFVGNGFKVSIENSDGITFGRGNSILTTVTLNPLKWQSKIKVKIQGNEILADFDINTTGQTVTIKEEKLWDSFINNFKRSILEDIDLREENMNLVLATRKDNWNKIKWAGLGAVIFGVPCGLLGYFTGLDMLAPLGAAGGAMFLMMYKISKDPKKNAL